MHEELEGRGLLFAREFYVAHHRSWDLSLSWELWGLGEGGKLTQGVPR